MAKAAAPAIGIEAELRRRRPLPIYLEVWARLVREKPLGTVGLAIVLALLVVGIFANFIAPEGKNEVHTERVKLVPVLDEQGNPVLTSTGQQLTTTKIPGPGISDFPLQLMGYDNLGRSMLSRVIHGAQISLIVGLSLVVVDLIGATIIGMASAWWGGKLDTIIQRIIDGWLSFPFLVFLIAVLAIFPDDPFSPFEWMSPATWAMFKIIFALSVSFIPWDSRIIRAAALSVKENQYVDAARAVGASAWRINLRYILPNIMAPIIVLATLDLGFAILSEAALSFLGFGVPPPNPSWGSMLSLQGKAFFRVAPWIAIFPGLMLTLVVFGINMLGDALRDLLDPRLRGAKSARFTR